MTALRLAAAAGLAGLAAFALGTGQPLVILAIGAVGLVISLLQGGRRGLLALLAPAGLLALALFLLQAAAGRAGWELPLRSVVVLLVVRAAAGLAPWEELLRKIAPGSAWFPAVLFLWILRHFVGILETEVRRMLIRHRVAAPRRLGPGWFSSLGHAVAGIFHRSLIRAERFYIAQRVRGLDE